MREPITTRQQDVLTYVRLFIATRGFVPSIREIGLGVGLSSTSTIQNHLNTLERKGYIQRNPMQSRTIRLIEQLEEVPA